MWRRWAVLTMAAALHAAGPEQPLPFSHKVHTATAKLACKDCHTMPEKFGGTMGFPSTSTCMACHILIAKDSPAIRKLAQFAASKQAIPWVRVYRLEEFVFFDHRFHLMNQAKCEDCHGSVAAQDVVSDDLGATKMVFCQSCHVKTHAAAGCITCHNTR
ncbi:MAG: cytochrome c3 family protein [Ignavibacteriota bacterium]